ncbi:MAG TPA: T9SS type A sorting domain-containing protein [Flavobacteriales bacterium]|nr:T9SS type A sorting domain-containing protein [Flavobacteriales bacterium]
MKKLLLLFTLVPCLAFGQTTAIPDANFEQALIDLGYDNVIDGSVLTANIDTVTNLDVYSKSISDLTGIEDFTALTSLSCDSNQLYGLDVSQNSALINLHCSNNQLISLDVSNNTSLVTLWCRFNQVTNLDVSNNSALTSLDCGYNQLTNLDVSNNASLVALRCSGNLLDSVDVSQNTALIYLSCITNPITSLDLSQNTALTELYCSNNLLSSLDISQNTALTFLGCSYNQLTNLDVSNNSALDTLWCNGNLLDSIDLSQNTALTTLACVSNQLTSLDVSNNTALTSLNCSYNQLTTLNVSKNSTLTSLQCTDNATMGCLNVKNGNNTAIFSFNAISNSTLICIEVDDSTYCTNNPTWNSGIDSWMSFSEDCNNACSSCNFSVSATANVASCSTCADGTATAVTPSGTPPYTYSWNTNPVQTSSTATGLLPNQWYCVSLTDSTGCTGNACTWVSDTSCIALFTYVVYGQDSVVFTNTSTGTGPFNISFGDGNILNGWTSTNFTHVYASPGTYNVCLIDSSCMDTYCDSIYFAGCTMTATITGNSVSCYGACDGSATVLVTGGTPPIFFYPGSGFNNLCPGTYYVTIIDLNGCDTTVSYTINEPVELTVTTSTTGSSCSTCADGTATATASGGTGPYTYSWNTAPVQTGNTATGLLPNYLAIYQVIVTDSMGCTASDWVEVCDSSYNLSFSYVVYGQDSVVFTNTSTTDNGLIFFGDGNYQNVGSQAISITHVYATPGTYEACLVDTMSSSCSGQDIYCDSVYIAVCISTTGTAVQTACDSYTWIDGNTYTTSNNTATYTLANSAGCDSVVTLDLTINIVEDGITNNSPTLTADASGASYQWLDCNNNFAPITGETNQNFTATVSGNYAVEVSQNNCTDTSDCQSITLVDLPENKVSDILIHPNPTTGILTIEGVEGSVSVYDIYGRMVLTTNSNTLDISQAATGIYFVRIVDEQGRVYSQKVIKQ